MAINIRQQSVNGSPNWIGLSSSPDAKKPESGHLKRKDWGHESVLNGLPSLTAAESSRIAYELDHHLYPTFMSPVLQSVYIIGTN